jgi:hypothetical protein
LRDLLTFASDSWLSTDLIVRECLFDPALPLPLTAEGNPGDRQYRDLPVNMFTDGSRNGRRYALGALKVLYWRECVAWRQYSRQAIDWRWVGAGARGRTLSDWKGRVVPTGSRGDPYIDEAATRDRANAHQYRALARLEEYQRRRQAWIEEHYPEAAEAFRLRQQRTRAQKDARAREIEREARRWRKEA